MRKVLPIVIMVLCIYLDATEAKLNRYGCQENTYLCDTGNNELCNANSGKCECDEGYFAVDDVCAPNGRTGDLCREGTIGSNGRCMCYYGYTRLTDNTCGLCTSSSQCNTERGVVKGLGTCISDGYDSKCFKQCRWNSQCTLSGQKCLEHQGHYVCKCPEGLFKHPDGSCNSDPTVLGDAESFAGPQLAMLLGICSVVKLIL